MIIGITGTDGAGKGTVVEYLVNEKGFTHYSASGVIMDELIRRGIEGTRPNLRLMGNELRALHGSDYLIRRSLEKAGEAGDTNIVVESLRTPAEAETLRKAGGIIVAIDADQRIRFERVQSRRSSKDQVTFEQFQQHEQMETNDPNPHGMQKQKVIETADYVILNNESLEDLKQETERVLETISESHSR